MHTTDPSWAGMDAAIWSVVEVHSAILCSSLPTLRPLIRRLIPSLLSSHRPSEYGGIRTASNSAYGRQSTFPSGSVEGLRDSDTLSRSEFAKSKTCITKCSTGGMEGLDDDDLELKETGGKVLSRIMVKRETVVQKEIRLEK